MEKDVEHPEDRSCIFTPWWAYVCGETRQKENPSVNSCFPVLLTFFFVLLIFLSCTSLTFMWENNRPFVKGAFSEAGTHSGHRYQSNGRFWGEH